MQTNICSDEGAQSFRNESVIVSRFLSYALVCLPEGKPLPATVSWRGNLPRKGSIMQILQTGEKVKWTLDGKQVRVYLPASITQSKEELTALAFSYEADE